MKANPYSVDVAFAESLGARYPDFLPDHPVKEWREEVANGRTVHGYWGWVWERMKEAPNGVYDPSTGRLVG